MAALTMLSTFLVGCGGQSSSSSSEASSKQTSSEAISSQESSQQAYEWTEPTYLWSQDNASCTATRAWKDDATHEESETVKSEYAVVEAQTCAKEGKGRYTATFQNPAFSTQTKDIVLDKDAHVWDKGKITRYPSILEEGVRTFHCDVCGETMTEVVDKVVDQTNYSLDGEAMEGLPGVFSVKAEVGASKDNQDNPATIGVPLIAKQNLADYPTYCSPGIIQGAAINYEVKTGPTTYEPIPGKELLAPYSYFRWSVMTQTSTDADGNVKTFDKLSGFDGSYYIIRVDVSDIIANKTGYLHVQTESNKAMMVALGMGGGVDTGVKATDEQGQATARPTIEGGEWHVGDKTFPVAKNHTVSQAYAGTNGNWYVGGTSFGHGQGTKVASYCLDDNAAELKDKNGNFKETPYIDVILLSSDKLAAGADTGIAGMPSSDIPLSFYVDDTFDYNPELIYDPASTDVNHPANVAKKYFDPSKAVEGTNLTSYIVKGGDLEIDIATQETTDADEVVEYWSLDKAINYPAYNAHTLKLICEIPVLEGLRVSGVDGEARSIALDVNSFDIQIANHSQTGAAGLTVDDKATLTLLDHSNTVGAELAIGNNAKMEVLSGGTLIIDETCQLEVEYDAASKAQPTAAVSVDELITKINALPADPSTVNESHRASIEEAKALYDMLSADDKAKVTNYAHLEACIAALPPETPLSNGEIFVRSGGKIINRGIVNIEGLEAKPNQGNPGETGQQIVRDMRAASLIIESGAEFVNDGCLSVKGDLYVLGKLTNNGNYEDVIKGTDPDKGIVDHHRGIQIMWKDDVTVLKEGTTDQYTVNPDVKPGTVHIGIDAEGVVTETAELVNYGDIVLAPGKLEVYGIFRNLAKDEGAAGVYLVTVSEAVVPIVPTAENPTKLEERRTFDPPYASTFDVSHANIYENSGVVSEATIEIIGNGLFGKLTPIQAQ